MPEYSGVGVVSKQKDIIFAGIKLTTSKLHQLQTAS